VIFLLMEKFPHNPVASTVVIVFSTWLVFS
jgi:hypothetical protein